MSEFGIAANDYVSVVVKDKENKKHTLKVNPVGRFEGGSGCIAIIYAKGDRILALQSIDEFCDYLLKWIVFDNLDGVFDDEPDDFCLGSVLKKAAEIEEDEDNSWYLSYFKKLNEDFGKFRRELGESFASLKDINEIVIHQYHDAAGEMCDFVDYTCCPEGEEEDVLREFFENNLTADSEIDKIMDCFEDGFFYGYQFSGDEQLLIDVQNKTYRKTMTITDVF